MQELKATSSNVLYTTRDNSEKLNQNGILLNQFLSRETQWNDVVAVGPESILQAGDEILMSSRPASSAFEHNNTTVHNTSDASVMGFKRNGVLGATKGTILYEIIEPVEQVSPGGIVLAKTVKTKEFEPIKCLVHAAGPDSGVMKGDVILLTYKNDCYSLKIINGIELHNAGKEEIIAYWREENTGK